MKFTPTVERTVYFVTLSDKQAVVVNDPYAQDTIRKELLRQTDVIVVEFGEYAGRYIFYTLVGTEDSPKAHEVVEDVILGILDAC